MHVHRSDGVFGDHDGIRELGLEGQPFVHILEAILRMGRQDPVYLDRLLVVDRHAIKQKLTILA